MADGRLKLLNLDTRVRELTRHLAENAEDREFMDMNYFRMTQMIAAMSEQARRLYDNSANGANHPDNFTGLTNLKSGCDDLYLALTAYANRYLAGTSRPDGPAANFLRSLTADLAEDRETLREVDFQPGMSMMLAVYNAQKKREAAQGRQEEDDLPGYEEVHGVDYPGANTLYGMPRQTGRMDPPEPQLPSQNTIRMQEGNIGPADRPREPGFFGTETFYQNNMELPNLEEIANQRAENRRRTERTLQIWTVAPLTNAIMDETAKENPAVSEEMRKINLGLQTLFHTVYPFNPKLTEEPRIPNAQELAAIRAMTEQAWNDLARWKQAYLAASAKPSEQVLFMADNVMKKLADDHMVAGSVRPGGETLGQAALRCGKLEKHFGLMDDRKTPKKSPVLLAREAERARKLQEEQERQEAYQRECRREDGIRNSSRRERSFGTYIALHTGPRMGRTLKEKQECLAKVITAQTLRDNQKLFDVKTIRGLCQYTMKMYGIERLPEEKLDQALSCGLAAKDFGNAAQWEIFRVRNGQYAAFSRDMKTLYEAMAPGKAKDAEYQALRNSVRAAEELSARMRGKSGEEVEKAYKNAVLQVVRSASDCIRGREKPQSGAAGRAFENTLDALAVVSKYTKNAEGINPCADLLIDHINQTRGSKQPIDKNSFAQNYGAHAARKHSGVAGIDSKPPEPVQPKVPKGLL